MGDSGSNEAAEPATSFRSWGVWAALVGAAALAMAFAQMAAPMMEPGPPLGVQIGEIVGDIKRSALRSFIGMPPAEPEPSQTPHWVFWGLAATLSGIAAILLSLASALRGEDLRLQVYGVSLGASALLVQMVWWVALLVLGMLLLLVVARALGAVSPF